MQRTSWVLGILTIAGVWALSAVWSEEPPATPAAPPAEKKDEAAKPAKPDVPVDVTALMKEWNSDKFLAPPTEFRAGHVTPRELAADALKKTQTGFEIQLPSKAPVPTPSVYKGKLYVSGGFHSKEFYCFDAATGKFVWGIDLDDDGPTSAVCDDGVIVFNTESCTVFAVDAATGKQLWSLWLGDPLTSTPTIAGGKVFTSYPAHGGGGQLQQLNGNAAPNAQQQAEPAPRVADDKQDPNAKHAPPCSHVLAALDLKTGKILWQRWIDSDVMSAPVAVEKEIYVSTFAGTLVRFQQADGAILSAKHSRATSAPVVVGGNVFFTCRADNGKGPAAEAVAALDRAVAKAHFQGAGRDAAWLDAKVQAGAKFKAQGGQLDAGNGFAGGAPAAANAEAAKRNIGYDNVSTMQAFQGSRILHFGQRNFNCMGDEVVCTDPVNGKQFWSYKIKGDLRKEGGFLAAPPAAAGGHLFVTTLGGEVLQLEPKEGKVVKKYNAGAEIRFQPAIEGGRIYIGTQDGRVICLDTGDATLTGWPCWGGNPAHTGAPGA